MDHDIEETDDLLENSYLNDGFDDVDCDVDDLMKTKGRVSTVGEAKTVDEDISQQEKEKEDNLLDYSDFFGGGEASTEGAAIMQLKSVPVMKQNLSDPDTSSNIFPLPSSERRHAASPQVDEAVRESRSSHDLKRGPSPIIGPKPTIKMSKALSKKIANKEPKSIDDLPPIASNRSRKPKQKARAAHGAKDKGEISSAEKEAASDHRLPLINGGKSKVVPLKSKRNKADIAQAREKYMKAKRERVTANGHGRGSEDPVSPRINFKYDSRLGLFGFDIEAERQSKRENYELMRIAKKNEEIAVMARARAQVKYGAGVMDAKTIVPGGGGFGEPLHFHNPRSKAKNHNKVVLPSRDRDKMRPKSDFRADQKIEHKVRSISSENNSHNQKRNNIKNKHIHKAHMEDEMLSKYKQINRDAMQCSPIEVAHGRKKKKGVQMGPSTVIIDSSGDDFYTVEGADVLSHQVGDGGNDNDEVDIVRLSEHEHKELKPANKKRSSDKKVDITPLKLSAIKRKRDQDHPPTAYVSSPRHGNPTTPTAGDKKKSFQRKPHGGKKRSKSPRKSPRKRSPRRPVREGSPVRRKVPTKYDVDLLNSVSVDEAHAGVKSQAPSRIVKKKTAKGAKRSIADELFEEFESLNVNSSPPASQHKSVNKLVGGKKEEILEPVLAGDKKVSQKGPVSPRVVGEQGPKPGNTPLPDGPSHAKQEEKDAHGRDDDDKVYEDEDFDDDNSVGGVDFTSVQYTVEEDRKVVTKREEEEEQRRVALEKKQEEEVSLAAQRKAELEEEIARKQLEEDLKVKEQKRKARALARAEAEEAERVAQKLKRDEAEAEAEAKRQAQRRADLEEAERAAREREAQEETLRKREADAEEARAAQEKEEVDRIKRIDIVKEEKLERASKCKNTGDNQQLKIDSVASPMSKQEVLDEGTVGEGKDDCDDDHTLEDEEGRGSRESPKRESSSPVLFDLTPASSCAFRPPSSDRESSGSPIQSTLLSSPVPEGKVDASGPDSSGEVLFDFKKKPPAVTAATKSSLPTSEDCVDDGAAEDEYGSDYDDDFD